MSAALLVGWLASGLFAAEQSPPSHDESLPLLARNGLDDHGNLRLTIDSEALAKLRKSVGPQRVEFPISLQESVGLTLDRFEAISPNAQFQQAGRTGVQPMNRPDRLFLRGAVVGEPNSHAFLSFTPHGNGTGFIFSNGRQLRFGSDRSDVNTPGLIVRSGMPGAPPFDALCGTRDVLQQENPLAGGPPPVEARGPRVLTVAVVADHWFCDLFTGEDDAQAYIAEVIAAVSDIYRRDLGFTLQLKSSQLWPDGGEPFGADDIEGFRDWWNDADGMPDVNLVHMFSGRRDLPYGGVAFLVDGCSNSGFGISGIMLGEFPTPLAQPDLGTWDVTVVAHEMGHNLGAQHTHSLSPPVDNCANGSNERGTIMSYCHTRPGGLLNIDLRFHTRSQFDIIEDNPASSCLWHDCNGNGVNDADDIESHLSADENSNDVPDECEDCNGNGILDPDEISAGALDVNHNNIPDECESDCNGNGMPDRWETLVDTAIDLNGNRIPDECEADCDGNAITDFIEIADGTYSDLDRDSAPDNCQDCDGNGHPDWIDIDRQFNWYLGQTGVAIREYHAASGVFVQSLNEALTKGAYDIVFGPDRQAYVAQFLAHRIIKVEVDTGVATVFVAPGSGGLARPSCLAFGPDGNLYVASQTASNVLKYNGTTGALISLFVPGGSGSLSQPWDMTFGPDGHLYVVSSNNLVLKYNGSTGAFLGVFINSVALDGPRGIAFLPNGDALVANRGSNRINRYDSSGKLLAQFNDEYALQQPWGITIGPNGNVFVASISGTAVRFVEYDQATGRYIRSFIRGDGSLITPTQFAFRPASPNDANANNVPDNCDAMPCKADIAPGPDGDGMIDVDDLAVILDAWGPCPGCAADIAPAATGGDNLVNVDDLLLVISTWGECE